MSSGKQLDANKVSGTSPGPCVQIGLRVPDAAHLIGSTPGFIETQLRSGVLPYRMIGQERIIAYEDLRKFFESIPVETGSRREPVQATRARKVA